MSDEKKDTLPIMYVERYPGGQWRGNCPKCGEDMRGMMLGDSRYHVACKTEMVVKEKGQDSCDCPTALGRFHYTGCPNDPLGAPGRERSGRAFTGVPDSKRGARKNGAPGAPSKDRSPGTRPESSALEAGDPEARGGGGEDWKDDIQELRDHLDWALERTGAGVTAYEHLDRLAARLEELERRLATFYACDRCKRDNSAVWHCRYCDPSGEDTELEQTKRLAEARDKVEELERQREHILESLHKEASERERLEDRLAEARDKVEELERLCADAGITTTKATGKSSADERENG